MRHSVVDVALESPGSLSGYAIPTIRVLQGPTVAASLDRPGVPLREGYGIQTLSNPVGLENVERDHLVVYYARLAWERSPRDL